MAIGIYADGKLYGLYDSIAAAARAVGVDPSNAGKVLRGARSSAGGYSFERVAGTAISATRKAINDAARAAKKRQTAASRKRQERQRAAQKQRQEAKRAQQRQAAGKRPRVDPKTKQLREDARRALLEANNIIRNAKKEGRTGIVEKLQAVGEALEMQTSTGLLDTKLQTLRGMDDEQLQAIIYHTEQAKLLDFNQRMQHNRNLYTISDPSKEKEFASKVDALDALDKAFEKMRKVFGSHGRGNLTGYGEIFSEMQIEAENMTADQIENMVDKLLEYLDGDGEKEETELLKTYQEWYKDTFGQPDEDEDDEEGGQFEYFPF